MVQIHHRVNLQDDNPPLQARRGIRWRYLGWTCCQEHNGHWGKQVDSNTEDGQAFYSCTWIQWHRVHHNLHLWRCCQCQKIQGINGSKWEGFMVTTARIYGLSVDYSIDLNFILFYSEIFNFFSNILNILD